VQELKAFGYARVSVVEERIENQVQAIEEFCRANGIELLKIFTDIGVSGSKPAFERDGFKQLLEAARLLDIRTIVVYDLTRLGRDLFDLIETYRKLLEDGYTVLFVKHPELNAKPDSPIGEALRKALLTILGVVAELERAFIRERTRVGMLRAKKEGKHVGRPPYPFPADYVKQLLSKELPVSKVWRLLVSEGKICRDVDGIRKCMSYETFRRKVKCIS